MSHNDKIYCFTCKKITLDIDPIKIQDSRFNSEWQDRCIHCLSFFTLNTSNFFTKIKYEIVFKLTANTNKEFLQLLATKLKKLFLIKEIEIKKSGKFFILYSAIRKNKFYRNKVPIEVNFVKEVEKNILLFSILNIPEKLYSYFCDTYKLRRKSEKQKALNTMRNIVISGNGEYWNTNCWYCGLYLRNLNKLGCCPRCGTNLKKYNKLEKHSYPEMKKIDRETLGDAVSMEIADANDEQEQW